MFGFKRPVKTQGKGIIKSPGVIGVVGEASQDCVDSICLGFLDARVVVRTFRLNSLPEAAVRAMFGWSPSDSIDALTGLSSRQVSQELRQKYEAALVAHLSTIRALSRAEVFILFDIQSQAEIDWVRSQAGKVLGMPGTEHDCDYKLSGIESVEGIHSIVERLA